MSQSVARNARTRRGSADSGRFRPTLAARRNPPRALGQAGRVVDHQFADPGLAALYDGFCPWERYGDYDFYLRLVMAAGAVLDVGCGTGALLRRARAEGHAGRLCGLDPAVGMLEQARKCPDVEWILGDLSTTAWDREFDLVVMSGHAFQVFVDDAEIRAALEAIRAALTDDGRFAFETRNPSARAWDEWTPQNATEVTDAAGTVVRMAHEVETPVVGDVVRFTTTYSSADWDSPQVSRSTLRFLDADSLTRFLTEAGLAIDQQCGDWTGGPLTDAAPEIITIARRA
jgi:ubiquinone/menaquinone biosynthesis C-methylase UbiE